MSEWRRDQRRSPTVEGEEKSADRWPGKRNLVTPAPLALDVDPGKRTPAQSLRQNHGREVFDREVTSAKQHLVALELALHDANFERAFTAATMLRNAIARAATELTHGKLGADARPLLRALEGEARPLLDEAPSVSDRAYAERLHGRLDKPRPQWDREAAEWRSARTGVKHEAAAGSSVTNDSVHERHRASYSALFTDNSDTEPQHLEDQPHRLPDSLRGELESATSMSLAHVNVHSGPAGDATARAHGARAVTIGSDIFLAETERDLDGARGRELLAHEVAHVVQASGRGPSQATAKRHGDSSETAEVEADQFATQFTARSGSLRWTPTISIPSGRAMRKENHDVANAHLETALQQAKNKGQLVTAPAYLHSFIAEIRKSVRDYLIRRTISLGDRQLRFTAEGTGGFVSEVMEPIFSVDKLADVHRFRDWFAPTDVYALIDRNRPLFDKGNDDATDEYMKGPTGPMSWAPSVPVALATTLDIMLDESLRRVGPRMVSAAAKARASGRVLVASDVVPSTPLDWQVIQAMFGRDGRAATVEVIEGALTVDPKANISYRKIHKVEWQGSHGGPWNALRVIEPIDANVHEVAAGLLGSPAESYLIKRVGDYFVIPAEVAQQIDEAKTFRPEHAAAELSSDMQLAFGPRANESIAAESARARAANPSPTHGTAGTTTPAGTNATATKPATTPVAPKTATTDPWVRVDEQLRAIAIVLAPLGFGAPMTASLALHAQRKLDPGKASPQAVAARREELTAQFTLLTHIASELGVLASQYAHLDASARTPASPLYRVLVKMIRAATLAHLPETGQAAFDEAHELQRDQVFDLIEGQLGATSSKIELVRDIGQKSEGDHERSALVLGANFPQRRDVLRQELTKLRAQFHTEGHVDANDLERVTNDIKALDKDAELVMFIGAMGQQFALFDSLEDDNWTLFSEYATREPSDPTGMARLERVRLGAFALRNGLQIIHGKWVAMEKRVLDLTASLGGAGVTDAATVARNSVAAEVEVLQTQLRAMGGIAGVKEFLDFAQSQAKSIAHRRMVVQIATMVGLMIASMVTGQLVEGAALAAGMSGIGAQLVGLAADTMVFTALNARLSGEPLVVAFASNLLGNLATFGAMRAAKALTATTWVGRTATKTISGAQGVEKAVVVGAKLADLTITGLVTGGVQFAQSEYESMLRNGRTMSLDELAESGVQAMAMMIGGAIVHHGFGPDLEVAKGEVAGKVGRALDRRRLEALAREVSKTGDAQEAIELLREVRVYYDAELARWKELQKLSDPELAAKGMSRPTVDAMGTNAHEALSRLAGLESPAMLAQLGLDAVIPGQVYAGYHDRVAKLVDELQQRGQHVEPTHDGFRVASKEGPITLLDRGEDPAKRISASQQVTEEMGAGSREVTASAVPGSSFKGKGETRALEPRQLIEAAKAELATVAAEQPGVVGTIEHAHVDATVRRDDKVIAENTSVIPLDDGSSITIRIAAAPLDGQTVARSVMNPTKQGVTAVDRAQHTKVELDIHGRYVIQLSDKLDAVNVRRAVAHEAAEILARRKLGNRPIPADVLKPGSDVAGRLSPHDHGRAAEIKELAKTVRNGDPHAVEEARHELAALVEDMGLRKGAKGADERAARLEALIGEDATKELEKVRAAESSMSEVERKRLGWLREDAHHDRSQQAAWDRAHRPMFERPTTGLGRKATKAELQALASRAKTERETKSRETIDKIRAANAAGQHPKMRVQIGGNAALAARDPEALLVDANERWAKDSSDEIAQTAQQMEAIKDAGFGDPYEFADADERVPLEAVRFMQDKIAAQGPVVDGYGVIGRGDHNELVMTILPGGRPPPLYVQIEGIALVTTGFTKENAPGGPRNAPSPRQALNDIDRVLQQFENDHRFMAMAQEARARLSSLEGLDDADAAKAVEALPPELQQKLVQLIETISDADLRAGMRDRFAAALLTLKASAKWVELKHRYPNSVFSGDEANQLTDAQIAAIRHAVIAGPGGTGISAAEIILRKNNTARVTMVGAEPPTGLAENNQFRSVIAKHATLEACRRLHVRPDGADGRFEFIENYYLGAPKEVAAGRFDVNASLKPGATAQAGTTPDMFQGDTYISALGRFNDLPTPIAKLANEVVRSGGKATKIALSDDDGHYVGYRLTLRDHGNNIIARVDVSGAASRFADERAMPDRGDVDVKRSAEDHDAPSEGGNFPGGYTPTITQTHRYASRRMRQQ